MRERWVPDPKSGLFPNDRVELVGTDPTLPGVLKARLNPGSNVRLHLEVTWSGTSPAPYSGGPSTAPWTNSRWFWSRTPPVVFRRRGRPEARRDALEAGRSSPL